MSAQQVGLIGCGRWGGNILRDLISLGCKVTIADTSTEARSTALELGACDAVSDATDLPPLKGVIIATPTSTHVSEINKVLDQHIPIFVEKPLSNDYYASKQLENIASDRIFVMEKWRYHPGINALADIAHKKELGAVRKLTTTRIGWKEAHRDVHFAWILAPHDLSIAREILGTLPPLQRACRHLSNDGGERITGLFGEPTRFECHLGVGGAEHRREVRLQCEQGDVLLQDAYADHIMIKRHDNSSTEQRKISLDMPLYRELKAFIGHLEGGQPPRSSISEANYSVHTITNMLDNLTEC